MGFLTKEEYEKTELSKRKEWFIKYAERYAKRRMENKPESSLNTVYIPLLEGRPTRTTIPSLLRENFFKYTDYEKFKDKHKQIQATKNFKKIDTGHFKSALNKYEEFLEFIDKKAIDVEDHTKYSMEQNAEKNNSELPLNQILYGPPGTGKTYNTVNKALEIIYGENIEEENRNELKEEFEELSKEGQIVFVTFHQSMSYEDFIEGIKPKLSSEKNDGKEEELNKNQDENSKISYEIKSGIFKEICKKAEGDPENEHILIIDEINRGNVSQIFGELITLIEEDKRLGRAEELKVTLPYSKKEFGVPNNLYIIGTMNTADRSVEALDTALRRRFSFIEMMPDYELEGLKRYKDIDLPLLLKTINERIEKLIDREHQIGHSYFLEVEDLESLKQVFKDKIIPLLQEYFFGDYGKIGLVLGENFFNDEPAVSFKKFKDYDDNDFNEKKIYRLKNPLELTDNDFKSIYE